MQRNEDWHKENNDSQRNWGIFRKIEAPFIGHNKPLVSSNTPHITPFICHNKPFVRTDDILKKHNGVTIIELMITLAIFAIIGAFALPNFRQTLLNHQTTARANEFLVDLNFARSEALKRGMIVEVCIPNIAQTNCDYGGSWSGPTGRVVGVRNPALGGALEVIRVREPLSAARSLREPVNAYTSVAFISSGLVQFSTGIVEADRTKTAVFGLCHDQNDNGFTADDQATGRDIRISPTGGIKITSPATAC